MTSIITCDSFYVLVVLFCYTAKWYVKTSQEAICLLAANHLTCMKRNKSQIRKFYEFCVIFTCRSILNRHLLYFLLLFKQQLSWLFFTSKCIKICMLKSNFQSFHWIIIHLEKYFLFSFKIGNITKETNNNNNFTSNFFACHVDFIIVIWTIIISFEQG